MEIDFATKQDIDEIKNAINTLTILVQKLAKKNKCSETITIDDICTMKNISRTHLVENVPYLMPNNGKSDYPNSRPKRWNIETYQQWEQIPIADRKLSWEKSRK